MDFNPFTRSNAAILVIPLSGRKCAFLPPFKGKKNPTDNAAGLFYYFQERFIRLSSWGDILQR